MKKKLLALLFIFITASYATDNEKYICVSKEIYNYNGDYKGRIPKSQQETIHISVSEEEIHADISFLPIKVSYIDKDGNYIAELNNGNEWVWYPEDKNLAIYIAEDAEWYMLECEKEN